VPRLIKKLLKKDTGSSDKTMDNSKNHDEECSSAQTIQHLHLKAKSKLFYQNQAHIETPSQEFTLKKDDLSQIEEKNNVGTEDRSPAGLKVTEAAATWNLLFPDENNDAGTTTIKNDASFMKSRDIDLPSE